MQYLPSSLSHVDLGLFKGTRPLGKRTRRGRTPSYHGVHGGHKALGLALFESLLERDFQTVLCADSRVKAYAVQSHQLNFWTRSASGAQTAHLYTPDVCALLTDGRPIVFEVKHSSFLQRRSWLAREPFIRKAYCQDHDVPFVVVTEREIRVQPRLSNYEFMLRHRHPEDDMESEMAIRDTLAKLRTGSCIGELCDASMISVDRLRRGFSAVIRLALKGELVLNLDEPLSLSTAILAPNQNA